VGGPWKIVLPDGRTADTGEVVKFEPLRRLAIRWQHELTPEFKAEGYSLCTMEIERAGEATKLPVARPATPDCQLSRAGRGCKILGCVEASWRAVSSGAPTSATAPATI
jgi:hypothetical protein